jgi:hypothetical protein
MSVVGLFNLSADMIKLKCDCGESEMSLVYTKDSKVRFTVPCLFCPNPHHFTVNTSVFFGKELFSLPCPYSGMNIAVMGETNKVKAELSRSVCISFRPSARLIMLEEPTPKRLLTALKARITGEASVTAAVCTGSLSMPTKKVSARL